MKHLFTTTALLFSMTAFAQVGINNTSPKATLDITAKTSGTKPEGLIIPQLSGDQIRTATAGAVYGTSQKGLIVYASSADTAPAGATASITAAGYYYFDGTNWQKISTGNTVSTTLNSGNILVGSASNVATAVSPTGDVTISNTGATSIGASKVTTTHLANNAVTVAKLPTGATATTFLRGDGTWVTPTDTNTTYTAGSGLTLTGTSFSANDATTTTKGIVQLAGDLAGTATSPTVAKIQNKTVSSTAPTNGQVLKYNTGTSAWEPAADTDTNTTYTAGSGLTLTGTSFSANDATTSAKGIVQLAGDLAGTATSPTVAKIQSKAVSSTAPTNGQVLKYNTGTSSWEPAADTDTNTTYTGSASINLNGTSFERTALSGDVTASANSNTTTIAANAVTSAKIADGTVANADLANMAALTVKGNATNAAAAPTDIAAGTDGYVLRRSGTALGFGTVDTAGITDGAVTASKLNQMSATSGQVLGWNGTSWAPTASDTTNDAWVNDTTNGLVKLGTKADGTARSAGTDFIVKDNGQIGIGTNNPDTSAILDIASTNKGVKFPIVALTSYTDVVTISSPATGLVVYNTTSNAGGPGLVINKGTSTSPIWATLSSYSFDYGSTNGKLRYLGNPDNSKILTIGNVSFRFNPNGLSFGYDVQMRVNSIPSAFSSLTYRTNRIDFWNSSTGQQETNLTFSTAEVLSGTWKSLSNHASYSGTHSNLIHISCDQDPIFIRLSTQERYGTLFSMAADLY
ncbi:hypothetical protein [Flavobacterium sp. B17]|uniref:beta strand repeat-containing protein n=1 Tax=Flavobacterium sp. B17 TaxID=95618 RepID=UPI0003467CB9|nr:hypothetical protein [Flavobacterium sp. B17]